MPHAAWYGTVLGQNPPYHPLDTAALVVSHVDFHHSACAQVRDNDTTVSAPDVAVWSGLSMHDAVVEPAMDEVAGSSSKLPDHGQSSL